MQAVVDELRQEGREERRRPSGDDAEHPGDEPGRERDEAPEAQQDRVRDVEDGAEEDGQPGTAAVVRDVEADGAAFGIVERVLARVPLATEAVRHVRPLPVSVRRGDPRDGRRG